MFPSCLKDINLNTKLKYRDFLWASRVKSDIWHMFCVSKTRADRGKLVPFLESAGQIYPETGLTSEAPKCVLASDIYRSAICFEQRVEQNETHFVSNVFFPFKS
jgi:hypothetical protein